MEKNASNEWQQYIDQEMSGSGYCKNCCILNSDGSHLASSIQGKLDKSDMVGVIGFFNDPKKRVNGSKVTIRGTDYLLDLANERTVLLSHISKDNSGYVFVKTRQIILASTYDDYITQRQCDLVLEKLADYLIQKGF